jgi:hypothetical protein
VSKHSVNQVIQRAISDAAFRRQLQRDPANALQGFDLTKDERTAITSGDPTRLTALGVDQRMSKAFGLGGMSEVSRTVTGDDTVTGGGAAFLDEGSSAGTQSNAGFTSTDASGNAVLIGDPASSASAAFDVTGPSHLQSIEADLNSPDLSTVIVGDPSAAATAGSSTLMAPDGTSFDMGSIRASDPTDVGDGSAATAFEDAGGSGGGTASFDAGAPTGGYEASDPGDLSTDASVLGDQSGGLDTGGEIRPTEY